MATKILKCPKCTKYATWHAIGGVQCCHCGHGCKKFVDVPAAVPAGKIKTTATVAELAAKPVETVLFTDDPDFVDVRVEPGKQINLF